MELNCFSVFLPSFLSDNVAPDERIFIHFIFISLQRFQRYSNAAARLSCNPHAPLPLCHNCAHNKVSKIYLISILFALLSFSLAPSPSNDSFLAFIFAIKNGNWIIKLLYFHRLLLLLIHLQPLQILLEKISQPRFFGWRYDER